MGMYLHINLLNVHWTFGLALADLIWNCCLLGVFVVIENVSLWWWNFLPTWQTQKFLMFGFMRDLKMYINLYLSKFYAHLVNKFNEKTASLVFFKINWKLKQPHSDYTVIVNYARQFTWALSNHSSHLNCLLLTRRSLKKRRSFFIKPRNHLVLLT